MDRYERQLYTTKKYTEREDIIFRRWCSKYNYELSMIYDNILTDRQRSKFKKYYAFCSTIYRFTEDMYDARLRMPFKPLC